MMRLLNMPLLGVSREIHFDSKLWQQQYCMSTIFWEQTLLNILQRKIMTCRWVVSCSQLQERTKVHISCRLCTLHCFCLCVYIAILYRGVYIFIYISLYMKHLRLSHAILSKIIQKYCINSLFIQWNSKINQAIKIRKEVPKFTVIIVLSLFQVRKWNREGKHTNYTTEVLDLSSAQCRSSGFPWRLSRNFLRRCHELIVYTAYRMDSSSRQSRPCSASHTVV